jgi:murein DD-endopeptidase MepM/ murein hydrolase activator NlpD
MYKIFFLTFLLSCTLLIASTKTINSEISLNKKILKNEKSQQKRTKTKIEVLAKGIKKEEQSYNEIEKKLTNINNNIFLNRIKLDKAKQKVEKLQQKAIQIKKESDKIKKDIVEDITNRYSASIGVSLAKKQTVQEIIDKEIYALLLEESSGNILKLNLQYLKSTMQTQKNKDTINNLTKYIKLQEDEKRKYKILKQKKKKIISNLAKKHKNYQEQLKKIISKQQNLQNLLGELKILKNKEIQKERLRQKKLKEKKLKEAQQAKRLKLQKQKSKNKKMKISQKKQLDKDIDIEVRNIGSSSKGIRISKYKGRKTIAPLKSYKIVKEFGKYYDPVYKIELFNEALSMKPKYKNSKVYNVLLGKIVYAKKNYGTLENVVIVQHKGGLHTIYSHLDKIAPTLKAGKWIKKGFVVGRVSDTLMFQATKNSKYINPKDLFK